jgi:eukaryotic-like serine/threonine-protein kinase
MAKPNFLQVSPGVILGDYRIEEIMPEGRGGMARVVRASFVRNPTKDVALKISRPSTGNFFSQAILEEVETLKKFRGYSGVVQILPVAFIKGREEFMQRAVELEGKPWFFAMEYLRGGSLESHLEHVGVLPVAEAASLAAEVSRTLQYIHGQEYIHNDVKPDNILFRYKLYVGKSYIPVLIDFGIAAKMQKVQDAGSVHYMAPERLDETRGVIPPESVQEPAKADVWAVGVLLYRMLSGKLPFNGLSDKSVTTAIHKTTPVELSHFRKDIPPEVDELIITSCMAKNPRYRPTMKELIEALEKIGKGVPVSQLSRKGFHLSRKK